MAVTKISCPSCAASLKSAAAIAVGTKIKCPKCGGTFGYQPAEEEIEVAEYASFAERDGEDDDEESEPEEQEVRPRKKLKKKRKTDNTMLVRLISIGAVVLLLGGGAFASFVWPGFLLTAKYSEPLAFVPPESDFVASADLEAIGERLGAQAVLESSIANVFTAMTGGVIYPKQCKEKTGLEFKELFSHVTLFGEKVSNQDRDPKVVVIVKSRSPFQKKKVLEFLGVVESAERLKGKDYYKRMERGIKSALYLPSNRLLIFFDAQYTDADLEKVLTADPKKTGPDGELSSLIDSVRQGQLWFVGQSDPSQLDVGQMSAAIAAGGPEFAPLLTSLSKAKGTAGSIDLDESQTRLNVALTCGDSISATQINSEAQKLWGKYKALAEAGIAALLFRDKNAKPIAELAQEFIRGLKFTTQSSSVVVSSQVSTQKLRGVVTILGSLLAAASR